MKAACDDVLRDLPLYAEGELWDSARVAEIRLHLAGCWGCRAWVSSYDRFTREVLEMELEGDGSACEGTPGFDSWQGGVPRASGDRAFTERTMALVRHARSWRRASGFRRFAAAWLIMASLGAGALAWLVMDRLHTFTSPPGGAVLVLEEQPMDGVARPQAARQGVALVKLGRPNPDLESAWWVIGPEQEHEKDLARQIETVLYALLQRDASEENGDCLVWQARLGSAPVEARGRYPLLMVSEKGEAAIPLQPVSLPVRVAERDLGSPARVRLFGPTRRYRILWVAPSDLPQGLPPASIPGLKGRPGDSALRLPPSPRVLDRLPLSPERY